MIVGLPLRRSAWRSWVITWLINRALYGRKTYLKNPEALEDGSETKPSTRHSVGGPSAD